MEVEIITAELNYIDDCVKALVQSDLGRYYFNEPLKAETTLKEALYKKELYIALTDNGECVGFVWFIPNGAFHSFPYLHIIAVKEEYRNHGVGKQLLKFFEDKASTSASSKYFLTVDDFNPKARKLYEKLGYQCVGTLPDLYKQGIACHLMMKTINR